MKDFFPNRRQILIAATALCLFSFVEIMAREATISVNVKAFPIQTGLQSLVETGARHGLLIRQVGETENPDLKVLVLEGILPPEGFEIITVGPNWELRAGGPVGAMYGLFDLADRLEANGGKWELAPLRQEPHFPFRAIKFNLPWAPYREGLQMDQHGDICRDLDFWEAFLDMMARNRFNVLSLWSRHPFHYMVRTKNFPEACPFTGEELADWQHFWRTLFRMAKQRGIATYMVNWNIVVPEGLADAYGVKELNDTTELVRRYTRETVTQVINEYEDLTGLGVTLADWMDNFGPDQNMEARDRERWIEETFIRGIHQANRPIRFIHRSVLAGSPLEMQGVIDRANFPDPVHVEIKFNWSHGHSTPKLALTHDYHSGAIDERFWAPLPDNYRIQWMIRNEDFFILRWGEPDFIRAHIRENTKEYVSGYFVGSEGYIPAMDYSHVSHPHQTWQYAFEKQWLFYYLWGRLLYDPDTPDSEFERAFDRRYGDGRGGILLESFRLGSRMPTSLASFHSATWDYTLYSEGFLAPFSSRGLYDGHSAFISIDELIDHNVLDPGYWNIKDFVAAVEREKSIPEEIITPVELAAELEENAAKILQNLERMRQQPGVNRGALACELADLEAWALLSVYFSKKIRAGVQLHTFRQTGEVDAKHGAIALLVDCLSIWEKLSAVTSAHYREVPYLGDFQPGNTSGWTDARTFSWAKFLPEVRRDLEIARGG